MTEDLPRLRSLLGASTALWAGDGVRVEPDHWLALSGARSVDYNVAVCHGSSAGETIPAAIDAIAEAGVPAIVMVAGAALGEVGQFVSRSWTCIGSVPLMWLPFDGSARTPQRAAGGSVRRLGGDEVGRARAVVGDVFEVGPELAAVAIPPGAEELPGQSVWGAFDDGALVGCVAAVRVEDIVAIWSMATTAAGRRRGHGAALMNAIAAEGMADGARGSLLYSSVAGEPFYRALGFAELERWQSWSRPRWVLGRA